ncbi:ATP-dependent nuclease [Amycolatopsis sp. VS8301801F10]|uniref:ATP-dependent nuclease n=1 Tax=Amycolatopsis sp. VS8301801F10 TaxID=2652442 RepID=UPI0038FC0989
MLRYGIKELHFKDGTAEPIPPTGLTVIVGPNNAGKSALLREINMAVQNDAVPPQYSFWLRSITVEREQDQTKFDEWFNKLGRSVPSWMRHANNSDFGIWDNSGQQFLSREEARSLWFQSPHLGLLARHVVAHLEASARGSIPLSTGPRDPLTTAFDPIHKLWDDRTLEQSFSRMVKRAFGFDICINRFTQQLRLLVGSVQMGPETLPPSRELMEEYAKLKGVDEQGDGVKSFVGILLTTIASEMPLVLIDEPEAFLHPPQARLLGKYLVEETPEDGQVLVATHSGDVIEGILDSKNGKEVKIVRVAQNSLGNRKVSQLPPHRVANLWSDPLLRYSRMLDGLFQRGVILCESDGDCRFYSASLDVHLSGEVEHDLHLTHTNGKARFAKALRELRAFGVQSAVIGDIDILNDKKLMRALIEAAGEDWISCEADLDILLEEVKSRASGATVRDLKPAVQGVINRPDGSSISDTESSTIIKAVRNKSGWTDLKRSGFSSLEGPTRQATMRLVSRLERAGIFIVPVGELERWFPDLNAGHGPSFVTAALESGAHATPTIELRDFMQKIVDYFGIEIETECEE